MRLPKPVCLVLVLSACSLRELAAPGPQRAEDLGFAVSLDDTPNGKRLAARWRTPAGEAVAVASGVRLVLGSGAVTELPFVEPTPAGGAMRLRCAPAVDHAVTVTVSVLGDRARIEVDDTVELPSDVAELSIEFALVTSEEATAMEVFAPQDHRSPAEVAGDMLWRTPAAFVRVGRHALAVLPDVTTVRPRLLPGALEVDTTAGPPRIRCGLVAQRAVPSGSTVVCLRDPGQARRIAGQSIAFAIDLRLWADAAPQRTLADLARDLWRQLGAASPAGPTTFAMAPQVDRALRNRPVLASRWTTAAEVPIELPFGTRENTLLLAAALATCAEPAARDDARSLVQLALQAPQRGGLSPDRARIERGRAEWSHGPLPAVDPASGDTVYDATAVAWTRVCGLLATRHLTADDEVRVGAERAALTTARFLLANQRSTGAVPALFEARYLAPLRDVLYEPAAESGAAALLLAECATLGSTDAAALRDGALAAVLYLHREVQPERAWYDRSTLAAEDQTRGRGTLCLTHAALAGLKLAETTDHAGLLAATVAFLEELALLQQHWSPVWLAPEPARNRLIGGFGGHDADRQWSDPAQTLAALAFLGGYRHLGRRDFLQRGASALRAGLATAPSLADDRLAATSSLGMAAAVAQIALAQWGSVVIDAAQGFTESLDAVQVTLAHVGSGEIELQARCAADLDGRATATFRGLPDVPPRYSVLVNGTRMSFGSKELAAGVELPALPVPSFTVTPPSTIQVNQQFLPRIRFAAPPPLGFVGRVALRADGADPVQVWDARLSPTSDPRTWQAAEPFIPMDPAGQAPSTEQLMRAGKPEARSRTSRLRASVELIGPDAQRVEVLGDRAIEIADETTIDLAGADDTDCGSSTTSPRVLFEDGARLARAVGRSSDLIWRLSLPATALALNLEVLLAGRLRLLANDSVVHEDSIEAPAVVRRVKVKISDRRLWEDTKLVLTFADAAPAAGQQLHVAELRTRVVVDRGASRDERIAAPGVVSRPERSPPDAQLAVLVLPIALTDEPLAFSRDQLAALFFGDNYRRAPGPEAHPTTGSVREVLLSFSGGRTNLVGEVGEATTAPCAVVDLGTATANEQLVAQVRSALAGHRRPFDLALVVHSGRSPRGTDGGELLARVPDLPPIVAVAERHDHSLLPVGTALAAILGARYGLELRSQGASGNFGALALTGHTDDHLPVAPIGLDLATARWVDVVDVIKPGEIASAATQRERRIHRLPTHLPGRGDLFLEVRGGLPEEPALPSIGLLGYWRLPQAPLVRSESGQIERPTILRLARGIGVTETPFLPGSASDLVARSALLDDASAPALATPQGELCFLLRQVGPAAISGERESERMGFTVEMLSRRVIDEVPEARVQVGSAWTAFPVDGVERGLGTVVARAGRLRLAAVRHALRAIWPARDTDGRGVRVFGQGRLGEAPARLRLGHGDTVVLDATLGDPGAAVAITTDLPPVPEGTMLWLEVAPTGAATSVTFDSLVLVPRARADHAPLRTIKTMTARLSDAGLHAPLLPLTTGADGRVLLREPVLVPATRAMLRLRCGLAADAASDTTASLDVELTSLDGNVRHRLLEGAQLVRGEGDQGLLTALLAIPPLAQTFVGVMTLTVHAPPGTTVWIANAEIARS